MAYFFWPTLYVVGVRRLYHRNVVECLPVICLSSVNSNECIVAKR